MLLRFSKMLGFDVNYLLSSGGWVVLRHLTLAMLGLVTSVALARLTSPDTLGRYQLILSVVGIVSLMALPGLNTAALKTVVDGERGGIRQAFILGFKGGIAGAIVLILLSFFFASQWDGHFSWWLLLPIMLLPWFWAPNHWYVFFEGRQHFAASSKRIILQQVAMFVVLMLVLLFSPTLLSLLIATFAIPAIFNTLYYLEVLKKEGHSEGQVLDLKYGLACTLQKASSVVVEAVQPLLIAITAGFASVAFYQVAYLLLNTLGALFVNVSTIYFPKLITATQIPHKKIAFYHIISGLVMATVYLILVKYCFSFFYGDNYSDSKSIALWILPAIILMPLRIYWVNYFTLKQKNTIPIASSIIAVLSATLVYLLLTDQPFVLRSVAFILSLHAVLFSILGVAYFRECRRNYT